MTKKAKILIVEDNIDHREHLRDALAVNYDVIESDSRLGCLEVIAEYSPDVVILDYHLQNQFSGLDVLREITVIRDDLPVLMVTAYGNEELAVEAMKSGARDYIRKTLDHSYIDKIFENIEDILSGSEISDKIQVKQVVLKYFDQHREEFIRRWASRFQNQKEKIGPMEGLSLDENQMNLLFSAFLADIQNNRSTETLLLLKKMVFLEEYGEKSLVAIELLNVTFRDIARELLKEEYPNSFDSRSLLMNRISLIVDENDFELSREYEKIISEAMIRLRQSERMATKSMLMTTLHHEIRQPLSFIYNTMEVLLKDQSKVSLELFERVLEQAQRIESILDRLEKDSSMVSTDYSEGLPMVNLPSKEYDATEESTNS